MQVGVSAAHILQLWNPPEVTRWRVGPKILQRPIGEPVPSIVGSEPASLPAALGQIAVEEVSARVRLNRQQDIRPAIFAHPHIYDVGSVPRHPTGHGVLEHSFSRGGIPVHKPKISEVGSGGRRPVARGWGRWVLVAVTIRAMDTSLIACFPDADLLVGPWRARFDPSAAHGIGAHITVASPFLTENCVKAGVLARVAAIASRHSVVVSFASIDLLPGAIALHPSSDDSLAALTADILGAWPQIASRLRTGHSRAYHLTVACSTDTPLFMRCARASPRHCQSVCGRLASTWSPTIGTAFGLSRRFRFRRDGARSRRAGDCQLGCSDGHDRQGVFSAGGASAGF